MNRNTNRWVGLVRSLIGCVVLAIVAGMVSSMFESHLATLTSRLGASVIGQASYSDVDTAGFLADAKIVYGALYSQVSTEPTLLNLFEEGSKFGKAISNIGARGYVILCRLTPNWKLGYRKEGTTGVGGAGAQGLANATVSLKYAYVPALFTGQALKLTEGNERAFMQAKALEAKFDMEDLISHVNVIIAGLERGGELARVSASGANSLTCDNAGNLPGALFMRTNQVIDASPVGGGAKSLDSAKVTAVNYTTRVVTHDSGSSATVGHAVALEDEYPVSAGDFPQTIEGLIQLVNSSGALQGLNPATAGQESWQSYVNDAGAADLSSLLITQMLQHMKNQSGRKAGMLLFPSAQIARLVGIATTTIRFDIGNASPMGKKALDLGFQVFEFAGLPIVEDKDIRNDRIYAIDPSMFKRFEAVPLSMADDEGTEWTRVSGASGIADAIQGTLRWYHQLGTFQRSAAAMTKNLTIPGDFATVPPTR